MDEALLNDMCDIRLGMTLYTKCIGLDDGTSPVDNEAN